MGLFPSCFDGLICRQDPQQRGIPALGGGMGLTGPQVREEDMVFPSRRTEMSLNLKLCQQVIIKLVSSLAKSGIIYLPRPWPITTAACTPR